MNTTETTAAATSTEASAAKKTKVKKTFTLLQRNTEGGFNETKLEVTTEVGAINLVHKSLTGADLPFGTNTYNAKKLVTEMVTSAGDVSIILNLKEETEGKVKHYNILTF